MDESAPPLRKIIHIDMDAFFASVEQRDNPELRGKPVAVGGDGPRGVVAAASYEARTFGVRSAMPGGKARRLCPELVFTPPRFEVYRTVSQQIRAIFERFTDVIQPLSLDEAYLDVTRNKVGLSSATYIAEEIRRMIREETGLTASAGVSYNKLIAKLASDQNKPDGICVITPNDGAAFVQAMPVERLHGIGPVTARRMHALGLRTGADLAHWSLEELQTHFGNSARFFHDAARGRDDRPVEEHRERKSISVEDTFATDLWTDASLAEALDEVGRRLWLRVEKTQAYGRSITLKVKFADFTILTRCHSLPAPVHDREELMTVAHTILAGLCPVAKGVRLLGLGLHNFGPAPTGPSGQRSVGKSHQLALAL